MIPTAILFGVVVAVSRSLLPRRRAGFYQGGALLLGAAIWGITVTIAADGGVSLAVGGFLLSIANALVGYGATLLAKRLLQKPALLAKRLLQKPADARRK